MKITNYTDFRNNHRLYSHDVAINMNAHGYDMLNHWDLDAGEKSLDAVRSYIKQVYGDDDSTYVYHRTVTTGWRLPYIFLYLKRETA